MVNLTIDKKAVCVPEGTTILDAARSVGIDIPTLCFLKDINEIGACRICMVEVEGQDRLIPSCNNVVADGMVVYPACYFGSNPYRVDLATCYAEHLGQGSWREPEYWAKHKPVAPVTWKYKVRWRVVRLLVKWARKMDYVLVRIHPDGRE